MKIQNNYCDYNSYFKTPKKSNDKSFGSNIVNNFLQNGTKVQATNPADLSVINSNLPVSYTKIMDISIPGLENKASLFRLSNGQKVVILPKEGPTYIRTSFNTGSFNEPDNLRGISHFIEHNLFNGSKDLAPGEYDKKLAKLGGYTNAYTNTNETQYYLRLQLLDDSYLEEAIKLNALQTQFPTFPAEQLEKEKEPVKSEIDMYKDISSDKTYNTMLKNLFNISSTSEGLIIGNKDNINSFTRDNVLDYYNTWYTPDNAVTVITGDVDVNETMQLVAKYYNKKPDFSHINKRQYEVLTPRTTPCRVDFTHTCDPFANISLGFPIEANTPKSELHKLSVLIDLLYSSNSTLSKKLDKYAVLPIFSIENFLNKTSAPKALEFSAFLSEEQVEDVLKSIYEGITDIINNPPSQAEINGVVKSQIQNMNNYAEYSETVSDRLVSMVKDNDFDYFEDKKKAISDITPKDISDLAKKFLDLNRISIAVSHPESTPIAQIKQNYVNSNKKSVSFGKSIDIHKTLENNINNTKRYKLQNNLELSIIPSKNKADSVFNLLIKPDVKFNTYNAELMVTKILLQRGTAFKNNEAFSKLKEELNTGIIVFNLANGLFFSMTTPPDNLEKALPLLKETLLSPNFTQEEFERAKSLVKEDLLTKQKSPYDKLYRTLVPTDKEYADIDEQLKALDKLTLNDIEKKYNVLLANSQASATLCTSTSENPQIQNFVINNLSVDMPQFSQFKPSKAYNEICKTVIDKECILTEVNEQSQADILQSYLYKSTENIDDIAKIKLLDNILGSGGMSSRLFDDLRNKEKLAYHVSSSLDTIDSYDLINLNIQTSTDNLITPEASSQNVIKALDGFKRNVDDLKTNLVSEEELASAKQKLISDILDSTEGNFSAAMKELTNKMKVYGVKYDLELVKAIEKVTVEDIRAAANYVFANKPITSIVASKKTLDELKPELNLT